MNSNKKWGLILLMSCVFLTLLGTSAWILKNYIDIHSRPIHVPEKALGYVPNLGFLPFMDTLLWGLFIIGICIVLLTVGMFIFRSLKEKIKNSSAKRKLINEIRRNYL